MSDYPWGEEISTVEEFEEALGDLLAAAGRNGVDPRGSWVCNAADDSLVDWEVLVYELDGAGDD